jgi:propionyl-CoA carboxylase beta chain
LHRQILASAIVFSFFPLWYPLNSVGEAIKEYQDRFANPFVAAERGYIDEVIRPRNTRGRIVRALNMLRNKTVENPWKKHDNIPL